MAVTPATAYFDNMGSLMGNLSPAVQVLPGVNVVSGKERAFISSLTLAAQTSGTVLGVARLPLLAALLGITVITDTSLGSSTIKFGDAASGNSAIYGAAATLTATDTPTVFAKTATYGVPITSGYDCVTGALTSAANNSGYGGAYEDIIMTIGAATMPASGNLRVIVKYAID